MTLGNIFNRGGRSSVDPIKLREAEERALLLKEECRTSLEGALKSLEASMRRVNGDGVRDTKGS